MLKNSLSLICAYQSSSSDEESQEIQIPQRLPVPNIVLTNKNEDSASCNENEGDLSLHDGRIRSFPHERGNWASYICIPYENENIHELTQLLLNALPASLNVKQVDDFHVTLTRTLVLKYHWIDSFVDTIKSKIILLNKFLIFLENFEIYCNEERTRTFIGICVKNDTHLLDVVKKMDECLTEFNLPTYYKEPSFHISIAWCVGDLKNQLETYIAEFNQILNNYVTLNGELILNFEHLKCKIGNKTYHLPIN